MAPVPQPTNGLTHPLACSKLSWLLPRHTQGERQRMLESCLGQRLLSSRDGGGGGGDDDGGGDAEV